MTPDLPPAIANYFAADASGDLAHLGDCFTATAVVTDEGRTYRGRDAILAWKASSSTQYSYTVEPFALAQEAGRTVVTSHLEGDFPGSPVDLRYLFALDGDKIATLEIVP